MRRDRDDQDSVDTGLTRRELVTIAAGATTSVVAAACKPRQPAGSQALSDGTGAPAADGVLTRVVPRKTAVKLGDKTIEVTRAFLGSLPAEKRGPVFLETLRQNKDPRALHGLYDELRQDSPPAHTFINIPFAPKAGIGLGNRYERWLAQELPQRRIVNLVSFADVAAVFADPETFTTAIEELRFSRLGNQVILGMRPSDKRYERERRAMLHAVRAQDLSLIAPAVRRGCDEFLDAAASGPVDVVAYAKAAPLAYNLDYFGFTPAAGYTAQDLSRWGIWLNEDVFYNLSDNPVIRKPADESAKEMRAYLEHLLKTTEPSESTVVGRLLAYKEKDPEVDDDALRRALGAFVIGSHLTTSVAITHIVAALLDLGEPVLEPARAAAKADDDATLSAICFEAARFNPIGHSLYRVCEAPEGKTEVKLPSGAVVPDGAVVLVSQLGASLDPAAFPDPYAFRLDRGDERNLLFCLGRHRCFGAAISQIAIPEAVKRLLLRGLKAEGNQGRIAYHSNDPGDANANRFYPKSLEVKLG